MFFFLVIMIIISHLFKCTEGHVKHLCLEDLTSKEDLCILKGNGSVLNRILRRMLSDPNMLEFRWTPREW